MRESLQRVFLYIFGLPEFNSELYFSKNFLVPALGNLSTLRVQHCKTDLFIYLFFLEKPAISGMGVAVVGLGPARVATVRLVRSSLHVPHVPNAPTQHTGNTQRASPFSLHLQIR